MLRNQSKRSKGKWAWDFLPGLTSHVACVKNQAWLQWLREALKSTPTYLISDSSATPPPLTCTWDKALAVHSPHVVDRIRTELQLLLKGTAFGLENEEARGVNTRDRNKFRTLSNSTFLSHHYMVIPWGWFVWPWIGMRPEAPGPATSITVTKSPTPGQFMSGCIQGNRQPRWAEITANLWLQSQFRKHWTSC